MKKILSFIKSIFLVVCIFVGFNVLAAKPGEITVNKTAQIIPGTGNRAAKVELSVTADSFNKTIETNVVLVLDVSTSMKWNLEGQRRIDVAKANAKKLVADILTNEAVNSGKVKMGLVTFGTNLMDERALTNSSDTLNNAIDNITIFEDQGTNVDAGLRKADEMLNATSPTAKNIIVLLTDGEPTFHTNDDGIRLGNGNSDKYCAKYSFGIYCKRWVYCSEETNKTATKIKNSGKKIYTVAFTSGAVNAQNFLKMVSSGEGYYYNADNASALEAVFKKITEKINRVATNAVVEDKLPENIELDEASLPAGVTFNKDTRVITWNIGNINAGENPKLTYNVTPTKGVYGIIATNEQAKLRAKSAESHPLYGSFNEVEFIFPVPQAVFAPKTLDDDYTAETIYYKYMFKKDFPGVLLNDELNKFIDVNSATSTVKNVVVIENKDEFIDVAENGSFVFKGGKLGLSEYKYHIETTIMSEGKEYKLTSNTSIIKFNVVKKAVNVVIKHIDIVSNKVLDEINDSGFEHFEYTANAKNFAGYTLEGDATKTLVLVDGANEIGFYYNPNTDTKYVVRHFVEKLTGDYELREAIDHFGTTGELTEAKAMNYEGFTPEVFEQKEILGDGSTVVEIKYNRNKYKVKYVINGLFANPNYKEEEHKYGEALNLITDDMTKVGYTFNGWFGLPVTMPAGDVVVEGSYKANTDTMYVVKHLLQELDGTYTLDAVEDKTGTTGELTEAKAMNYKGFTAEAFEQKEILGDGSTVVEIKYNRNKYRVKYVINGLFANSNYKEEEHKYGEVLNLIADDMTKVGYTFNGWFGLPATMPAGDVVVEGSYKANTDTMYVVKHLLQELDGTYTLDAVEDKTGTTGELTEAKAMNYKGFTAESFEQKEILGDGSTVVEIKYNRNKYKVIVHYIDQETGLEIIPADEIEVLFGNIININPREIKGYKLIGEPGAEFQIEEPKDIDYVFYYEKERVEEIVNTGIESNLLIYLTMTVFFGIGLTLVKKYN